MTDIMLSMWSLYFIHTHKIMHVFNMKVEAKLSKGIKQTNMKDMPVLNTLM